MQCHRSRIDALRAALAAMPTDSNPYAGKNVDLLDDATGLRIVSRMQRHSSSRSEGRLSLAQLAALSHRWSRQRASGKKDRGRR